jgi:hypothetical protein
VPTCSPHSLNRLGTVSNSFFSWTTSISGFLSIYLVCRVRISHTPIVTTTMNRHRRITSPLRSNVLSLFLQAPNLCLAELVFSFLKKKYRIGIHRSVKSAHNTMRVFIGRMAAVNAVETNKTQVLNVSDVQPPYPFAPAAPP